MRKRKTATAIVFDSVFCSRDSFTGEIDKPWSVWEEHPEKIRVTIPSALDEARATYPEVDIGIIFCGLHRGRRWGVVKYYSQWVQNDGTCVGDYYIAFDLNGVESAKTFRKIEEGEFS